jgi:hypothetical protein
MAVCAFPVSVRVPMRTTHLDEGVTHVHVRDDPCEGVKYAERK